MYGPSSDVWFRRMAPTYGYIIDHTWELRCIDAEVRFDGRQRGCFLGCRCANELVHLFDPIKK